MHDIQSETDLLTPLTEPLSSEQSGIQPGTSSASAALQPRVFINNNESNISCFSVASDATSTPLQALNGKNTAKPPSTIPEESEDESCQSAQKGLIGETPRRRSQDNNIRPPPVRRISHESFEEDETPLIAQPEGSVEREMRKVFGEKQSSQDLDELAERVGTNDSSSESDDSRDCREAVKINKRRNAISTRRKSSFVINGILEEIQEEANTSNKENSLPSPERSLEEHIEDVSPSKAPQPQTAKRQAVVNDESQLEEPEDQASTAPVGEPSKKTRGRPRKVAEIASDEDDEEEPPKKMQKSPPRRMQKSPLKKMQKATPKKAQKSPPKKVQKAQQTPTKKIQQTPTKTLRQRNAAQKPQDSDVEEVLPVKRAKYRRVVVQESSSDDEDDEEFKDAQPDVQESSSEDKQAADAEHVPVTRVVSVELDQLNPSESMLEVFNKNFENSSANSERASSVETVASCSENGDAPVVTKGQPSRKRDLSTESDRSEASSTVSMASSTATETTLASTSSQVSTTTRKRKPKPEPVRKSRPPRRKARLAPGSLAERSLLSKLRRSK